MKTNKQAKTISRSKSKTLGTSDKRLHASKKLLIDADNLTVILGNERVVDQVSFCIHKGEFIGLIGSNGAGKTTLLRAVLGLLPTAHGHVMRHTSDIAYIPQQHALYTGIVPISVLEVVALGAKGVDHEALEVLKLVEMDGFAHKRFEELSGGQQQRVAIAKALSGNADILILDEPATGIDERAQKAFYELLQRLRERGITIIMVSHEVETVLRLVTRVICLNRTILYDGSPAHFEADTYMPQAYKAQHRQLHHHHMESGYV